MSLGLVNATNARDLGGLVTTEGRRVRTGLVFRANALNRLTDADVEALGKLGLSCVVDLRSLREVEMVGPDRLPSPAPQLIPLPLSDPGNHVFASVTAIIKGDPSIAEAGSAMNRELMHSEMLRAYRWIATSDPGRTAVATVLRLIAEPDGLPLLFHCSAGKDRTGWLAAVVLTLLGVDRATVEVDYLRTTELNQEGVAHVLSRLEGKVPDPTVVLPMLEVRPEYLAEAFTVVDREYGDIATYVRDGLGIEDEVIAELRARLLD